MSAKPEDDVREEYPDDLVDEEDMSMPETSQAWARLKANFMRAWQQKALWWAVRCTPSEDVETLAAFIPLLDATARDQERAAKAAKV